MKKKFLNAYNELKNAGVPVYTREDIKGFGITSEEANSYKWVNYWEGYKFWGSDTNPVLDDALQAWSFCSVRQPWRVACLRTVNNHRGLRPPSTTQEGD